MNKNCYLRSMAINVVYMTGAHSDFASWPLEPSGWVIISLLRKQLLSSSAIHCVCLWELGAKTYKSDGSTQPHRGRSSQWELENKLVYFEETVSLLVSSYSEDTTGVKSYTIFNIEVAFILPLLTYLLHIITASYGPWMLSHEGLFI